MMNINHPLLSVIIPVYNTEKFLRKCLDSIVGQTYRNLEVIIVNDGSLENENAIIKEYIELDDRIRIIQHQENKGLFQARITGMEAAKGEYFAFINSDDSISTDYYRLLIKKAIEADSDMVIADIANECEDGNKEYYNLDPIRLQDLNLVGKQVVEAFMRQQGLYFGWHAVWNKIYKRSLIEKCFGFLRELNFNTHLNMADDIVLSCLLWSFSKKTTNIHNVYYFHLKHQDKSLLNNDLKKFEHHCEKVAQVFTFFKNILIQFENWENQENNYIAFKKNFIETLYEKALQAFGANKEVSVKKIAEDYFEIINIKIPEPQTKFFTSVVTELDNNFQYYENIKGYIKNLKTEYIGFDIFDTLIQRPFYKPTDLFFFLNEKFNNLISENSSIDFSVLREEGEKGCRIKQIALNPINEDVTIHQIYEFISEEYKIDKQISDTVRDYEMELELRYCYVRSIGKELFELAEYCGKKIIIISDMYLPKNTIEQILNKNGYESYEKLYLSNELGLSKYSGAVYRYVIEDLKISDCSNFGFIGDNYPVDVVNAQTFGLVAFHLPKAMDLFENKNNAFYSGGYYEKIFAPNGSIIDNGTVLKFIGIRCMLSVVANKLFDNPFVFYNRQSDFNCDPRVIGYFMCGMFLFSWGKWVGDNAIEDKVCTVHFVSRDGYFLKQAYDVIRGYAQYLPKSNYVYLSRKAICPLYAETPVNIYELFLIPHAVKQTPKNIIELLKNIISEDKYDKASEICVANGINYNKVLNNMQSFYHFIKIFIENFYDGNKYLFYRENLKGYFSELIKENDILVDIGYSGRMEKAISSLLNRKINSYYLHIHEPIAFQRMQNAKFKIKSFYSFKPASAFVVREQIFTPPHPSCVGYSITDQSVTPIFEDFEISYAEELIANVIQNSALQFVRDFMEYFGSCLDFVHFNYFDACMPLEFYLHYAVPLDRKIFSAVKFEDDFGTNAILSVEDYWNKEIKEYKLENLYSSVNNISIQEKIVEVPVEVKVPLKYEEFLEGKPRWKKALFMWLFDKKLLKNNLIKWRKNK